MFTFSARSSFGEAQNKQKNARQSRAISVKQSKVVHQLRCTTFLYAWFRAGTPQQNNGGKFGTMAKSCSKAAFFVEMLPPPVRKTDNSAALKIY